jgi:hypothetical protein
VSASLPKLAVISIYLGIFQDRVSRWCCWVVGLVLCVGPAVSVPMLAFQCRPVAYLHDKTIPGGRCWNQALMFRYGSIPNIVTDVVMLILPMPLIWGLHVSFKVKIGLLFTFLLGSMWVLQKLGECFVSLIRSQGLGHIYSPICRLLHALGRRHLDCGTTSMLGYCGAKYLSLGCMLALFKASTQVSGQRQWFVPGCSTIMV